MIELKLSIQKHRKLNQKWQSPNFWYLFSQPTGKLIDLVCHRRWPIGPRRLFSPNHKRVFPWIALQLGGSFSYFWKATPGNIVYIFYKQFLLLHFGSLKRYFELQGAYQLESLPPSPRLSEAIHQRGRLRPSHLS